MERLDQLKNLLIMAAADGRFSDEEIHLLSERATIWGIGDEDFDAAVEYALSPQASLSVPSDEAGCEAMIADLLQMMAVDGQLAEQEKRLFAVAAATVGVDGERLDQLIDRLLRDHGE